jgi:hypothetical protein
MQTPVPPQPVKSHAKPTEQSSSLLHVVPIPLAFPPSP